MYHIGIDLGGTKIEGALLDSRYRVVCRRRVPTPKPYRDILDAISNMVELLAGGRPHTTGVGGPGTADDTGRIRNSNTASIRGMPLKSDIQEALGARITLANDADCFALAESRMGAGRGLDVVFGAILGTGVGGGISIRGNIHPGRAGMAGEWGHCTLHPGGNRCWCGKRGCVEAYISGPALERSWARISGTAAIPIQDIVEHRPPGYDKWRDTFLEDFGLALSGVVQVLDPDAVVLGGGLSNVSFLYDQGIRVVRRAVLDGGTPVLPNMLGDSAGVIGAAILGAGA